MPYVAIVPSSILHLTNAETTEKIKLKICKLSVFTLHAQSSLYDIDKPITKPIQSPCRLPSFLDATIYGFKRVIQ